MRAAALALLMLGLSATTGYAAGYRLLVLDGQPVKWGEARFGKGAVLTYSFVQEPTTFPDAINCKAMVPVTAMLRYSKIDVEKFRADILAAFRNWEQVANLRFTSVDDPSHANILIGAQATPRGIAFTNVWHKRVKGKPLAVITRASFCFNPELRWERSFDGDANTPSLGLVASHEIGHTIGLDHPGRTGQLMGFRYSEDLTGLQPGDVMGVVRLYGVAPSQTAVR